MRLVSLLVSVVLAASGMACGGDDGDEGAGTAGSTAATTTTTASPPTTLTPEEAAEATYLEFIEVVDRLVTEDPNPDDPELAQLAIDPVLGTVRDSLTTLAAENQVWQQGERTGHTVSTPRLEPNGRAVIRDCLVEDDVLVDNDDGAVVHTQPLATRTLDVTLLARESGWVVADIEVVTRADGEVPCAE